jgi:hypothetical protein
MRTILSITALDNYQLKCTFSDGSKKIADITAYLNAPAFLPLQTQLAFKKVTNKNYFVAWEDHEIDLSADTLWHIGIDV